MQAAPVISTPWHAATADGGLKPSAPALYGVVRGKGVAAVRFQVIDKAIGYTIRIGDRSVSIPTAAVGTAVVTRLDDGRAYEFTVTATNANGESVPSKPVTAPALSQAAQ